MSEISKLEETIKFELEELGVSPNSPRMKERKKKLAALKRAANKKEKLPAGYAAKGWNADGTMDVMGGYVLDMKQNGKLIGTRNSDGSISRRNPGGFIPCKAVRIKNGRIDIRK